MHRAPSSGSVDLAGDDDQCHTADRQRNTCDATCRQRFLEANDRRHGNGGRNQREDQRTLGGRAINQGVVEPEVEQDNPSEAHQQERCNGEGPRRQAAEATACGRDGRQHDCGYQEP
jgi:hypothetical protein